MLFSKIFSTLLLFPTILLGFSACSQSNEQTIKPTPAPTPTAVPSQKPDDTAKFEKNPTVTITMEDGGVIELELYPEIAPITVANFVELAESGFYNGTVFHRIYSGFMIQGGSFGPNGAYKEAPKTIKGEFSENGVKNDLKHERGVISMARTNVNDSASSGFFIMHADSSFLDNKYAAFGKVTKGIEVVDKIAAMEVVPNPQMNGEPSKPVKEPVVKSITVKR